MTALLQSLIPTAESAPIFNTISNYAMCCKVL